MGDLANALQTAVDLILHLNGDLGQIIVLSLEVAFGATALGCVVGLPLGAAVAVLRFPGRGVVVAILNASMELPSVVVGVFAYVVLSRTGPLGASGLLFTPVGMTVAQSVLVFPLVAGLTRQTVADLHEQYHEHLRSFGSGRTRSALTLLWDGRFSLVTATLAGFDRAIADVGAVIIVGGNIAHFTRVLSTATVLESSKGDLPLALALGIILLCLALGVSLLAQLIRDAAFRRYG